MHACNQTSALSTSVRDVSGGLAPLAVACCTADVCSEIVMASEGLSSNVVSSGSACAPELAAAHHRCCCWVNLDEVNSCVSMAVSAVC
jgi:hypothetical protein